MRLAPLVLLLSACAARRPVDVTIESVQLGPGKHTGEVWDGLGSVPPEARQAAAAALAQMDPALGLGAVSPSSGCRRWRRRTPRARPS